MIALARFLGNWRLSVALITLSVLLGVVTPIAFGLSSMSVEQSAALEPKASPSPSPSVEPSPSSSPQPPPTSVGVLGTEPKLAATGGTGLVAQTSDHIYIWRDGATDWVPITGPSNSSGIVADIANPNVLLAGGSRILVSGDGTTWKAPKAAPPQGGTYLPLLVNGNDANVWFFNHQGKLLRTRDGGVSWRELTTVPTLVNPVLVPGSSKDQFFLAIGSRVLQLDNNGQGVIDKGRLPAGAVVIGLAVVSTAQETLLARAADGTVYLGKAGVWTSVTSVRGGPIAAVPDKFVLVANGGGALKQPGHIVVSTDQGATWKSATGLPADQTIEAVTAAPDASLFFAYGFGGDLFRSTDGVSWTILDSSLRG